MKSIKDNFDTIVYQIPIEQIDWPQKEKVEIAQNIINLAEAYKVDAIVSNFAQAVYNSQHLIKSNIPIMFIEHCVYPIPNTIYRWNQGINRGHSMFLVSKWQEKKYEQMSKRTKIDVLKIAGYINPSYCKVKPKMVEPEYDCGTIGRCDNGKSPFKLKTMTKGTDIKSLVLTSQTQFDKDALVKAIKSFDNIDRKAIQESTWEKHNKKQWKKDFTNAVDKTIEIFRSKNG